MPSAVIAATGLYTPPNSLSNEELVETFNTYVERFNATNAEAIAAGEVVALQPSSPEFITKASGIKSRFVMDKTGLVDPEIMRPILPERPNEEISTPSCAQPRTCSAPIRPWRWRSRAPLASPASPST